MDESASKWRYCPLCARPYALDVPTTDEITRSGQESLNSAVPVQSNLCSHVLCLSCVREKAHSMEISSEDEENLASFVQCPICLKEDAFDATHPIISTMACDLLKLVQEQSLVDQEIASKKNIFQSKQAEIDQESGVAQGSLKLTTYAAQLEMRDDDREINHDSKVPTYKPEVFVFDQEPNINSNDGYKDDSDEEIHVTANDGTNIGQTGVQEPRLQPVSLPGAFPVAGPRLNSSNDTNTDTLGSYGNHGEVLVQATLVEPPPPDPEIYTAYAEPVVPFLEKYKWLIRGGFSTAIIVIIAALAITIPRAQRNSIIAQRNSRMTSITLQASQQNSSKLLGVSQRKALDWILGPNNAHYDPTKDQDQIAQRYILATLYYSTEGGNWTQNGDMLTKNDECDWHESINCSQGGSVVSIQLGKRCFMDIRFFFFAD